MAEEAVPVVLLAFGSQAQLERSVSTKMMRASGQRWSSSLQTYQSALGLVRSWRDSWNQGCWSLVWFMTRSAMTRMPRLWASSTRRDGVGQVAVLGQDGEEVADVVAAVAEGRLVEGQQPEAVDAEPLEVVELLGQAPEVAGAVVVGVEEAADEHLVEDRPSGTSVRRPCYPVMTGDRSRRVSVTSSPRRASSAGAGCGRARAGVEPDVGVGPVHT